MPLNYTFKLFFSRDRIKPAAEDTRAAALVAGTPADLAAMKQRLWVSIMNDTASAADVRTYNRLRQLA